MATRLINGVDINPTATVMKRILMSQQKREPDIWNSEDEIERERMREFWLSLDQQSRRKLIKLEKEAVLKKMKEQQKQSCGCHVCGKKRVAIEEELETLYNAYYDELEGFSNVKPQYNLSELPEDDNDEEYEDCDDEIDDFSTNLTVQGGLLTVADDLITNDGQEFLDLMEQLAQKRINHHSEMNNDIESDDAESIEGDSEEVVHKRIEEGRRMFQIFAARMFEQRVLAAYREKIAQERQELLLKELEEEERIKDQKQKEKQLNKEKKKKQKKAQKMQKELEKSKMEQEKKLELQRQEELRKEQEEKARRDKQREQERREAEALRKKQELERIALEKEQKKQQVIARKKEEKQKKMEQKQQEELRQKQRKDAEMKEKEKSRIKEETISKQKKSRASKSNINDNRVEDGKTIVEAKQASREESKVLVENAMNGSNRLLDAEEDDKRKMSTPGNDSSLENKPELTPSVQSFFDTIAAASQGKGSFQRYPNEFFLPNTHRMAQTPTDIRPPPGLGLPLNSPIMHKRTSLASPLLERSNQFDGKMELHLGRQEVRPYSDHNVVRNEYAMMPGGLKMEPNMTGMQIGLGLIDRPIMPKPGIFEQNSFFSPGRAASRPENLQLLSPSNSNSSLIPNLNDELSSTVKRDPTDPILVQHELRNLWKPTGIGLGLPNAFTPNEKDALLGTRVVEKSGYDVAMDPCGIRDMLS